MPDPKEPPHRGGHEDVAVETTEETIQKLMDKERWKAPRWHNEHARRWPERLFSWLTQNRNDRSYTTYFAHKLRSTYTELQYDFRALLASTRLENREIDIVKTCQVDELLQGAKKLLEKDSPDLLLASHTLETAQRNMIWLYREPAFRQSAENIISRLGALRTTRKSALISRLRSLLNGKKELDSDKEGFCEARTALRAYPVKPG